MTVAVVVMITDALRCEDGSGKPAQRDKMISGTSSCAGVRLLRAGTVAYLHRSSDVGFISSTNMLVGCSLKSTSR